MKRVINRFHLCQLIIKNKLENLQPLLLVLLNNNHQALETAYRSWIAYTFEYLTDFKFSCW